MRKIYLLMLTLFVSFVAFSQTVTIGTGTSTGRFPLSSYYGYERSAALYTAEQIGQTGNISSLAWYAESAKNTQRPVKIYLKTVTESILQGANWDALTSGATLVFDNSITINSGWNTLNTSTLYNYAGGNNNLLVLVETNYQGTGAGDGSNGALIRYSLASNTVLSLGVDNNLPTGNLTLGSNRPNIQINFGSLVSCFPPQGLSVSNITTNSSTINWLAAVPAPAMGYKYEVRTDTNPGIQNDNLVSEGTIQPGVLSLNLSNLNNSTNYWVFIKSNCTSDNLSVWSLPLKFQTECAAQNIPYLMPINETVANALPICVTVEDVNDDDVTWKSDSPIAGIDGRVMKYSFSYFEDADDWLYTNGLNLIAGQSYRLSFKYKNSGYSEKLKVSFGNQPVHTSMTNQLLNVTTEEAESVVENFIDFMPEASGVYYIGFQCYSDANQFNLYLGEISVDVSPVCLIPSNIELKNISKNSVNLSWNVPLVVPGDGYEYEIRTSGLPGSGNVGLVVNGTTTNAILSKLITGLQPTTQYFVYLRSVCSSTEKSLWSNEKNFYTLCEYPDLVSLNPATRCGFGTVQLAASFSDNSLVKWFTSPNDVVSIHSGTTFDTPNINETTSYFVKSGVLVPNTQVQVGTGVLASTEAAQSPYYYSYGGYKTQYIYTSQDLEAAGLVAGPINSIAFNVAEASSVNRNNFTIHIGTTAQDVATTTQISNLNLQYSNAAQPMTLGLNTYQFNTPFLWDGQSNIVVQVNWSNQNSGSSTNSGKVIYHTTPNRQTTYTYADNRTALQILQTMTGGVPNEQGVTSGGTVTSTARPNTYFNGLGVCYSPMHEVVATVTASPAIELSSYNLIICEGETQLVSLLDGATAYDSYNWIPSEGVTGNSVDGWLFQAFDNKDFTLIASQTTGDECAQITKVNVKKAYLPFYESIPENLNSCLNEVVELNLNIFQADHIIVGTDTTISGTYDFNTAFMNRFKESKQQYIYTKDELIALGLKKGSIGGLAFNITTPGSSLNNTSYTIKIKTTSESSFANNTFVTDGFTTVFGPAPYTHTETGWQNIMFANNFYWNGESNLLIEITQLGDDAVNNATTYYSTTSDNKGLGSQSNTALTATTGTLTNKRLNTKFFLSDVSHVNWLPRTGLYLDSNATTPYTGGNAPKLYAKNAQAGNYDYVATISTSMDCVVEIPFTLNVIKSENPVSNEQTFCEPTPVSSLDVTGQAGGVFKWYTSESSSIELTTIETTGVYYVQQEISGCKSERVAVNINIKSIINGPLAPQNQIFCDSATLANLQATALSGNTLVWYNSENGSVALEAGSNIVSGNYYVAQFNGFCYSPRTLVRVQINQTPAVPNNASQTFCGYQVLGNINLGQASGITLRWYSSALSAVVLSNNTQVVTGTYYVSQLSGSCESDRVAIQLTAYEALSTPVAAIQTFCGSATVNDLIAQGTQGATLIWYSSLTAVNPLTPTTPLSTGTYYVLQTKNGCYSERKPVAVRVVSLTAPEVSPITLCGQGTVSNLVIPAESGVTFKWYTSPSSTTQLPQTTSLSTGTYYVSRVQYNCESSRTAVSITIGVIPSAPTGSSTQTFVEGSRISSLILNQSEVTWYSTYNDSQNGVNPLSSNMPLVNGATYYAVSIGANGCPSLPFAVTVTVTLSNNEFVKEELKYFPNPVVDVLNLSYTEQIMQIDVFDLLGKKVKTKQTDDRNVAIDISDLASGTYMVLLKTENKQQFIKVIKK